MATSKKLTDHFLTCAVCLEVLTDPVTLVCYHTFCRKCVVGFTKTQADAIKANSLPCPFCGRLTKVTIHDRPVEEWANHLKPSFLIQGLIDSFGPGTKETSNCSLCHEDGEKIPAVAWCSVCDVSLCHGCLKAHQRSPASRHHDVSDLSGEVKVRRKRKVPCSEHKDEFIKFYCRDCKKTLCQSCCILYHRKCEDVVSLQSMLPEMKSKLKERKDLLTSNVHEKSSFVDRRKMRVEEVAQEKASLQSQVRSACQRVFDLVKSKGKCLMDEIENVSQKEMGQIKAQIKSAEMAIQIYQQDIEMIDQALESENETDLCTLYQSYDSRNFDSLDDMERELKETEFLSRLQVIQDSEKLNKVLEGIELIKTEIVYGSEFDLTSTPVLQDTIDIKVPVDESGGWLNDVIALEVYGVDTVVIIDGGNQSVKSFYSRNNKSCHSKLSLECQPFSLTQLKPDQVAVTLSYKRQIATVEVNPDLKLLLRINTQKPYTGITFLTPTTLAVSSHSPPCVDVIDMSGNVLRSLTPQRNGQSMLKYPHYLCTSKKGNILVPDWGTNSVLCLTPRGDVVFNYSPSGQRDMNCRCGIVITKNGDILVADLHQHCILQLTESGEFVKNILTSNDGLNGPRGLCMDKHGRLYIALYYGVVQVYKCTK